MKIFLIKSYVILVLISLLSFMKIINGRISSSPTTYSIAAILVIERITEKKVFLRVGFFDFKLLMKMINEKKYRDKTKKEWE